MNKLHPIRQALRDAGSYSSVIELRKSDDRLTLQQIADKSGVSRQRVYQILKTAGLPTASVLGPGYWYNNETGQYEEWKEENNE